MQQPYWEDINQNAKLSNQIPIPTGADNDLLLTLCRCVIGAQNYQDYIKKKRKKKKKEKKSDKYYTGKVT